MKMHLAFLLAALAVSAPALCQSQSKPATPRAELAFDYSYLHSNAPPSNCGCISMNGGSATFAYHFHPAFAVVGDITIDHAGGIASGNYDLTLSTFAAGLRYTPHLGHSSFQPFGQVLVGATHASGSLVSGSNSATTNAGAAFTGITGGGVDLKISRRFSIRLVEADYVATTFDNGVNNHQNNLRISTGVILRF